MNVHLIDLIFCHRFHIVFDGLLNTECKRRHVVTIIHLDADIVDDALLFKQQFDALALCVQQAYAVDFRNCQRNYAAHNACVV